MTAEQTVWQSDFEGPQDSPGFSLWRNFMRWQRGLNAALRPLGLTQPQYAILAVCGWMTHDGQEVTQQGVADFVGLDRMHVSQVAKRLEEDGLIERHASKFDQRAKKIVLTGKGFDLLAKAMPVVEGFDRMHFERVPSAAAVVS